LLNRLAISEFTLSPPTAAAGEAFRPDEASQPRQIDRLASLAASAATGRAALKQLSERLESLYNQAERGGTSVVDLEAAANDIM
jgi:hypothetical protein